MSALSKSKLEPQMGGGMMLGAYLATHLSIMLENFEVLFLSSEYYSNMMIVKYPL